MAIADALNAAIEAYPGRPDLCGALRISHGGESLIERAFGKASVQLGVDNHPGTRFHIASVTKMFIAAAVVRLAREGRVSLAAHPGEHHPALKILDRRITLHQLLSHTAGVADVYDQPNLRFDVAGFGKEGRGGLLDYLLALPPLAEPGGRWRYSTTGFLLLGYVLEAVVGAPFADVLDRFFFKPLGLADTGCDDPFRVNPGRATGQARRDGAWFNTGLDGLAEADGPRELYSTVGDLDRWASALMAGEVLDAEGLALSFTPRAEVPPDAGFGPGMHYGYGWFLTPERRFIGGMTAGFRATLWHYPAERLTIVMLWNNESVNAFGLLQALLPILRG